MILEEEIKHLEEMAEAEERSAKLHQRPDKDVKGSGKRYLSCLECAKEHRQLAEWLRELKKYRAIFEKVGKILADNGYTIDDLDTIFEKVNHEEE